MNLSCNFFRGSFDLKEYLDTVESFFLSLDEKRNITENVTSNGDEHDDGRISGARKKRK